MPLIQSSRNISPLDINKNVSIGVAFPLDSTNMFKGTQTVKEQIKSNLLYILLDRKLYLVQFFHPNNGSIYNLNDQIAINAEANTSSTLYLKEDGNILTTLTNATSLNYNLTASSAGTHLLEFEVNDGTTTIIDSIYYTVNPPVNVVNPTIVGLVNGVNYINDTTVIFQLYAPQKEHIYVIGDFNNWEIDNAYLLNKDTTTDRFWIELTGLTSLQNHTYQYLIEAELRIADPYSTIVLTESNDQYINNTTYPDLPVYPTGKTNHSVTLLKTGETEYDWQTTSFTKPKKTDLVIYELLIRDFDALHSFSAVKERLDYLQGLGINAIEFMPLMEFDGNESWGYNPSFHMALDKYYGTKEAFKSLIDECHARGIAIIVDVAFNHASGQNPYYRMWNTDNGNYGGQASADSPFFNETATHSYSVFNGVRT